LSDFKLDKRFQNKTKMNFSKIVLLISLLLIYGSLAFAQNAAIKGTVIDDGSNELLPFLNVIIDGTTIGTSTDIDGAYSLKVDAGTYDLVFSYLGYADQKITNVIVAANEVKVVDVRMGGSSETIEEIVITARQARNTENALLTLQKKSSNLLDGVSSQSFRKTGDANAAGAIKRVTGVSVQDGKYVFVRGLGDRYTKTLLNGNDIPGLDPDRNNVQMDIFPANLIDRIVVNKTFTPNLPGDFTGGIVDITTKDFPDSLTINLSYGTSYNPQTHFNDEFILYEGGKTDLLAFDDGTRALPFPIKTPVPDESKNNRDLTTLTAAFNPQLAASPAKNFLNQSISFSLGNQINKAHTDVGYNVALNYGLNYQYLDQVTNAEFFKSPFDKGQARLERKRESIAKIGEQDVTWSALIGTSLKIRDKNKLRFNLFHAQNGNTKASEGITINGEANPSEKLNNALFYTERAITNFGLSGSHQIKNDIKVNWRGAATRSKIDDPDLRIIDMNCEVDDTDPEDNCGVGVYHLDTSVGAGIRRDFRALQEFNFTGGVDIEIPFTLKNKNISKLQFGVLETYKIRDFNIQTFTVFNDKVRDFDFDPNFFFQPENIWTVADGLGTYIRYDYTPSNTYSATQNITAAYVMNEMPFGAGNKIKLVYGFRAEYFTNSFTGNNPAAPPSAPLDFVDSLLVEDLSILPAVNLVYNATSNMNIRAAYSKTVARPSFKEKSTVSIYDPISGRRYTGNINLLSTDIHNADLRWEYFFRSSEMISIGGFYKQFTNPIELIAEELQPSEIKPQNAKSATVLGIEFEFRKNFSFINENLKSLSVGSNFTIIKSEAKMIEKEYNSRKKEALKGEEISDTRSLHGQSPYIINAYLNYASKKIGLAGNLNYNVQGERLAVVGIGGIPDVYEQPFNSLNFKLTQSLIKNKARLSFNIDNILDQSNNFLYKSQMSEMATYNFFQRGRTFGFGFSYNF